MEIIFASENGKWKIKNFLYLQINDPNAPPFSFPSNSQFMGKW